MLQCNRRNECINGCEADTLGAPQPENSCGIPVSAEAAGFEHFPLRKIMLDADGVPREDLENFGDHYAGERKRLGASDHTAQLVSGAPRGGTEKINPHGTVYQHHLSIIFGSGAIPAHDFQVTLPDPCSVMAQDAFAALRANQELQGLIHDFPLSFEAGQLARLAHQALVNLNVRSAHT